MQRRVSEVSPSMTLDFPGNTDMAKPAVRVRGWAYLADSCHVALSDDGGRSVARTAPRRSSGRLNGQDPDRRGALLDGTRDPHVDPVGPPARRLVTPCPVERGSGRRERTGGAAADLPRRSDAERGRGTGGRSG